MSSGVGEKCNNCGSSGGTTTTTTNTSSSRIKTGREIMIYLKISFLHVHTAY